MELSQNESITGASSGSQITTTNVLSTSTNYNNLDHSTAITDDSQYYSWCFGAISLTAVIVGLILISVRDYRKWKRQGASPETRRRRLESKCLKNTRAPPKYEEMSEPTVNGILMHQHGADSLQIFTGNSEPTAATSDERQMQHELTVSAAPDTLIVGASGTDHSITSSRDLNPDQVGLQMVSMKQRAVSREELSFDQTDDVPQEPPSYDEYHKYESCESRL